MRYVLTPTRTHVCADQPCPVPLSPQAISQLYARYMELKRTGRLPEMMEFDEYYAVWRSGRRGASFIGLDDGSVKPGPRGSKELITRPTKQLQGTIRTIVLLV